MLMKAFSHHRCSVFLQFSLYSSYGFYQFECYSKHSIILFEAHVMFEDFCCSCHLIWYFLQGKLCLQIFICIAYLHACTRVCINFSISLSFSPSVLKVFFFKFSESLPRTFFAVLLKYRTSAVKSSLLYSVRPFQVESSLLHPSSFLLRS